jgi:hypothetical protein
LKNIHSLLADSESLKNNLKVRYSDIFVKFVIICGSGQIKGVDVGRGYVTSHGKIIPVLK